MATKNCFRLPTVSSFSLLAKILTLIALLRLSGLAVIFLGKGAGALCRSRGLKLVDLPNLVITAVEDTTELIKESLGVVAFGSTTLLESSFADQPVIMPAFEEAALESYKDKVIFGEEDDLFHIARAPEEMAAMLQKMTSEEGLPTNLEKAVKMFDTWISPVSGGAVSEYCKCIQQVIEASNGNDSKKKK